jgi:hypothetical protein
VTAQPERQAEWLLVDPVDSSGVKWIGWQLELYGTWVSDFPESNNRPVFEVSFKSSSNSAHDLSSFMLVLKVRARHTKVMPCLEATWRRNGTSKGTRVAGDVTSLTPGEWGCLGGGLVLLNQKPWEVTSQTGRPAGPQVWVPEIFDPLFEQVRRALRTELGKRPTRYRVWAAMRLERNEPLSMSTFRDRWQAANPGRRWDQLDWG